MEIKLKEIKGLIPSQKEIDDSPEDNGFGQACLVIGEKILEVEVCNSCCGQGLVCDDLCLNCNGNGITIKVKE